MINDIVNEAANVLIPSQSHPNIRDLPQCQEKCSKNLKKHIKKLVEVSLGENDNEYYLKVTEIGKKAFCENVHIITEHTTNNNEGKTLFNSGVAFEIIKMQALGVL